MISHDEWLGCLVKRNFITSSHGEECDIYLNIPDTTLVDVDLEDDNFQHTFEELLTMGLEQGWVVEQGCPVHDSNEYNYKQYFVNAIRPKTVRLIDRVQTQIVQDGIRGFLSIRNTMAVAGEDAVIYVTPWKLAEDLLKKANELRPVTTFVDIGCGVGLPMYIAKQYNYENIIGIDINEQYIQKAGEISGVSTYNIDAKDYMLPDSKAHIFMFNPFYNDVLIEFIKNNLMMMIKHESLIIFENNYRADHVLLHYGFKKLWQDNGNAIYSAPCLEDV